MARPLRIEFPGCFYHVTSRGNERKDIFKNRKDREKFLSYLQSSVERYGAKIHVYCLMTNHYHVLMETPQGNLSQIMRHINGAYTTYFNIKRKRTGHLFQGRYKAIVVEADAYALELSRYMHLNPVRVGMVSKLQDYEWSSYRSYAGLAPPPDWLTQDLILKYFSAQDQKGKYLDFVETLIGETYETPLKAVVASSLLGSPGFVEEISEIQVRHIRADRTAPAVKQLAGQLSIEKVVDTVKRAVGEEGMLWRKISIHLCHRYGGMKLKEIGEKFGVGDAAVSVTSKRLLLQAAKDRKTKEALEAAKKLLIVEP
ncbi:MAG: transposase [Geobacteraceae bacterium]|nr:transposase [Geobacteraceae bacterium]